MKRRSLITASGAAALATVLPGCGSSGSSSGSGNLRLLNASVDYASIGMTVDSTALSAAVAYGSVNSYSAYTEGTHTTAITDGTSSSTLASQSRSIQADTSYTLVTYGWAGGLKTFQLTDNEEAAGAGLVKFRTLNCAADAGLLNVYVTPATTTLDTAGATNGNVAGNTVSSYNSIGNNTYRIRVTSATDVTDVRMDVSGVVLSATTVMTLILVSGPGGVLVNGLLVEQGKAVTPLVSNLARVRVVASVASNAVVDVTAGSTALMTQVRAPTIGAYVSLAAGSLPLTVLVNGTAVTASNLVATSGSDYTVLVAGTAAAPTVSVITENNRLPLGTGNCKVRLLHGASALSTSGMSLTVNLGAIATNVAYGTASTYVETLGSSTTQALVEAANPLALSTVFSTSTYLLAGANYTAFILMGTNGPVGILRRER